MPYLRNGITIRNLGVGKNILVDETLEPGQPNRFRAKVISTRECPLRDTVFNVFEQQPEDTDGFVLLVRYQRQDGHQVGECNSNRITRVLMPVSEQWTHDERTELLLVVNADLFVLNAQIREWFVTTPRQTSDLFDKIRACDELERLVLFLTYGTSEFLQAQRHKFEKYLQ